MSDSDRDVLNRLYYALEMGLEDTEFTLSRVGDKIFIDADGLEWCIGVFRRVDETMRR